MARKQKRPEVAPIRPELEDVAKDRVPDRRRPPIVEVPDDSKDPDNPPDLAGDFDWSTAVDRITGFARDKCIGRLMLRRGDLCKSVYFRAGMIVAVKSNRTDELLGQILVEGDAVTGPQLADGLRKAKLAGTSLGAALMASGVLDGASLHRFLEEQARRRLLAAMAWPDGSFTWRRGLTPDCAHSAVSVDPFATAAESVMLFSEPGRVEEQLILELGDPRLSRVSPAPFDLVRFRLSGADCRVIRNLSFRARPVSELLQRCKDQTERDSLVLLLFLMLQTGLVREHRPLSTVGYKLGSLKKA